MDPTLAVILGCAMILAFFGLLFVAMVKTMGAKVATGIFVFSIITTAFVAAGILLLTYGLSA